MTTATSSFTTPTLTSISSAANGVVVIGSDHGWQVGDVVSFQGLNEMTELNGETAVIVSITNSTTFTIGDTSGYSAESTGGADTCNLAVDVSGYLKLGKKGEKVTVAISGTYSNSLELQRAKTPDQTAWEKVAPYKNTSWDVTNDTVSFEYQSINDNDTLRLVSNAATPTGTVAATLTDAARVVESFKDEDGNTVLEITETGISAPGTLDVTGVLTATGGVTGDVTGDLTGSVLSATQASITTMANLVTVGDVASGTLASGFGTINVGAITSSAPAITSSGNGTKNGATVSAVENGVAPFHQTVLTCTSMPIDMADEAAAGQYGGTLVYTFPSGGICFLGSVCDGTFLAVEPWFDTWTGDIGLGTVVPSDASGSESAEDDLMRLTEVGTASALLASIDASLSLATELTESGARWLDSTNTPVPVFLNMITDDHSDNTKTTGAILFTGTVTLTWINLGDIAA